jgi:hypothetical protein
VYSRTLCAHLGGCVHVHSGALSFYLGYSSLRWLFRLFTPHCVGEPLYVGSFRIMDCFTLELKLGMVLLLKAV